MLFYRLVSLIPGYMVRQLWEAYNQLLNEHSLADTGTSEKTNLSTAGVRRQQVDDLDTGNEDFGGCGLVDELWWVGVDGQLLGALDWATLVNRVTSNVHDTTKGSGADGNHDGVASVGSDRASHKTLGTCNAGMSDAHSSYYAERPTIHSNASHNVLTQMLLQGL